MVTAYLTVYYEEHMIPKVKARFSSCSDFIDKELKNMCTQVFEQARMQNFLAMLWAFSMMEVEDCAKTDGFNYDYCQARMDMFHKQVEKETEFKAEN